jgi:pyruvate dehydrogenase E1 component beta subunit
VCFLESELTYGMKGEVPDEEHIIPLGQAKVRRSGRDLSLITWGKQVFTCEAAAKQLEAEGIDVEVVDLRSLRPLDHQTLFGSVAKTRRAVVVHEGHLFAGVGAEIVARLQEALFDVLEAPVLRVTSRDVPQPYASNLEKLVNPDAARVVEAVRKTLGR